MNDYWFLILYIAIGFAVWVISLIPALIGEFKRKYNNTIKTNQRKQLLMRAIQYLKPFDNLWKYQILSNKNITIELKVRVILIKKEKTILSIKASNQNDIDEVWDTILRDFNNFTEYENLLDSLKIFQDKLDFHFRKNSSGNKKKKSQTKKERLAKSKELIDINNCSAYELTELAGINIILAKRIVNYRDKNNGFKTKTEFFEFVKLKPHFQKQLEESITVKKIKIKNAIKLTKERMIDL